MSNESSNGLHLPDLSISNFRGIDLLSIKRLGRVTLLGGRNGVGKTTVLEAVRTYASRGSLNTLQDLLDKREEFVAGIDEDHDPVVSPDYTALFHGRTHCRLWVSRATASSELQSSGMRTCSQVGSLGRAGAWRWSNYRSANIALSRFSHSSSSTISKRILTLLMAGTNSAQSALRACSEQMSNTDRL